MAGGTALRFVLSTDPCRPQRSSSSCSSPVPQERGLLFRPQTVVRVAEPSAAGLRHFSRTQRFSCSGNDAASPSSHDPSEQNPPQEAVLKAISEVSKTEGRVGQTTNVVIGGTVTDDSTNEWLALDKKVNTYPTNRGFTAIGTGGDDFVQAMVFAVESVIQQPIPKGQVKQKLSSRGKYVSVNIGPIRVNSSEQVCLSLKPWMDLPVRPYHGSIDFLSFCGSVDRAELILVACKLSV